MATFDTMVIRSRVRVSETLRTPLLTCLFVFLLEDHQKEVNTGMACTEIFGVKIEKNPPQSKLDELGIKDWPKWGCQPSKFPWTFDATETMYLLEGKVVVFVDGYEGSFEIGAGDLVIFPKGMKITWDVLEAVNKHYSLEK